MAKRLFLMKAERFKNQNLKGWFFSEKLDGMRAFWDGGVSRGKYASDIPWANTEKDGRYRNPPRATGLWSFYRKPIQAPDWFLELLPPFPLDGELWMGRGNFQELMSTVKDLVPGRGWKSVRYMILDSPPIHVMFAPGDFMPNVTMKFAAGGPTRSLPIEQAHSFLKENVKTCFNIQIVEQTKISSTQQALDMAAAIVEGGGEGGVVRSPTSIWVPQRSKNVLKIKPYSDAEGTVTGYTWGRETDKGSKLLGLMGALILEYEGKRLELSGFTEAERRMVNFSSGLTPDEAYARSVAGQEASGAWTNPMFPIGTKVTFLYRELSDSGIPKEARYHRVRGDE